MIIRRVRTPAVLVPYPHAADDHQRANAAWFAAAGAAEVLDQADLAQLGPLVSALLAAPDRLDAQRAALARLDAAHSLDAMVADLETLSTR
jgi:UDP-N-acetylglucosamine--N-acetylmuramyl-(pentapeptide) pyrophosphoryl-undecaprenol N-acetylglucosamine transferase